MELFSKSDRMGADMNSVRVTFDLPLHLYFGQWSTATETFILHDISAS